MYKAMNTQISKSDLDWRDSRVEFSLPTTVVSSLNGLDDEFLHNRVRLVLTYYLAGFLHARYILVIWVEWDLTTLLDLISLSGHSCV